MVAKHWGMEGGRVTANGHRVSFWSNENVLKLDSGDTTLKPLDCTFYVYKVCELYLNKALIF